MSQEERYLSQILNGQSTHLQNCSPVWEDIVCGQESFLKRKLMAAKPTYVPSAPGLLALSNCPRRPPRLALYIATECEMQWIEPVSFPVSLGSEQLCPSSGHLTPTPCPLPLLGSWCLPQCWMVSLVCLRTGHCAGHAECSFPWLLAPSPVSSRALCVLTDLNEYWFNTSV